MSLLAQQLAGEGDEVKTEYASRTVAHTLRCSMVLRRLADKAFGSLDEMKAKFNAAAAARFGSGWAWLGLKPDGDLTITTTANQDNPLQVGRRLLFCAFVSSDQPTRRMLLFSCWLELVLADTRTSFAGHDTGTSCVPART